MKDMTQSLYRCGVMMLTAAFLLLPLVCLAREDQPGAHVTVAPLRQGTISQSIVTYGMVVPAPGAVTVFSLPYESQVVKVFVSQGEQVASGDSLVQAGPSPDTRLKIEMAKTACKIAGKRLDDVIQKQKLKLAANDEVFQAQQAFSDASTALKSYQTMKAEEMLTIKTSRAGIVDNIYAHEGAIMPPGGPLVDVVAGCALEVRLGGEPEEAAQLAAGQTVLLSPVNRPALKAVSGRIRAISRSINTATRLIDIFVDMDASSGMLLNEFIKGTITVAAAKGFIVPRNAVLRSGDQYCLFTVKGNRAVRHIVQTGIENENEIQVSGEDLHPGEPVVILGNYELADQMTVTMEETR